MKFFDIVYVARTIWGEARGESQLGKVAVGWVIRNRRDSGKWFGQGTLTNICLRPWQFSCWNENDPNSQKALDVELDDPLLQKCLHAALTALHGMESDPTSGATHYYVAGTPEPDWAKGKTPTCTIGVHRFFADID